LEGTLAYLAPNISFLAKFTPA